MIVNIADARQTGTNIEATIEYTGDINKRRDAATNCRDKVGGGARASARLATITAPDSINSTRSIHPRYNIMNILTTSLIFQN